MDIVDKKSGLKTPDWSTAAAVDERARRILAAACRAIVRRGVDATRIADIAREAGTSTGTVHYYFETRDDVLVAALQWANEEAYRRFDRELEQDADPTAKLARLLELAIPHAGASRDEWVVWIELATSALHRPDLLDASQRIGSRWRSYFFDIVREGVEAGDFRPAVGADEAAERIVALTDGLGLNSVLGHTWMPPERVHELLVRFVADELGVERERFGASTS
jgi:AcrR family transcriptional regulator